VYVYVSIRGGACTGADRSELADGGFEVAFDLPTVGAVNLQYVWHEEMQKGFIMTVLRAGMGLSGALYQIRDLVPTPSVQLSYKKVLGMCDPLHLDARGSLNSGGRPFKDIQWSLVQFQPAVDGLNGGSLLSPHEGPRGMCDAMTLATATQDLNVFVPMQQASCPQGVSPEAEGWNGCWNSSFLPAGRYEMQLRLSNWIGGASHVNLVFEKRDHPVPSVMIANGPHVAIASATPLSLQGVSAPSVCTSGIQPPLKYIWAVTPALEVKGLDEQKEYQTVQLPPFAMPSGTRITFTLTASAGEARHTAASASVDVHVVPSAPIARLAGGDRLISLADAAPSSYKIDASSSETTKVDKGELLFHWTCQQNLKIKDAVIGLQSFDCALISSHKEYQGAPLLELYTEKLRKHAYTFSPDLAIRSYTTGCDKASPNYRCDPTVTYVFSVTVCDADLMVCSENSRMSASAHVEWSTSRMLVPEVVIAAMKSTRISGEFNAVAQGGVTGTSRPHFLWQQLGPEGSQLLDNPNNLLTPKTAVSLVMKPGLLNGADRSVFIPITISVDCWTDKDNTQRRALLLVVLACY